MTLMGFLNDMLPWLPMLFLLSLVIVIKKLIPSKRNLPPSPPSLPLIGNLHQLGALPHRDLWELSKKYGSALSVKLGSVSTVVVHSPETAEQVLKTHDADCCTRPKLSIAKSFFYGGIDLGFNQYNDYYRDVRKICVMELFSVKRVNSVSYIREDELARLFNLFDASASTDSPVELSGSFVKYVANFTCRMAFGTSFRGSGIDNDSFLEAFHEANVVIGKFAASDIFPGFGWIVDRITGLEAARWKSFRGLDVFFQQAIDDHLRSKKAEEGREDLIDILLKMQKEEVKVGSGRLTHNHIKAILMDLFLAGVDTSAINLDWIMAELVRHPRVLKKAQAEIRERVGNKGKITHEDLDHLDYMKMVIKESFRLHNTGSILIPREAVSKFKINGYDIYPGTRIHVNVWAIGRNPKVWKDPEEFIPERFLDNPIDPKGANFKVMPFGGGRRLCPGMHMGMATVEYTLANLLYHYDWKLPMGMKPEDVSIQEAPGLTIHRLHPLHLIPVKYQWS